MKQAVNRSDQYAGRERGEVESHGLISGIEGAQCSGRDKWLAGPAGLAVVSPISVASCAMALLSLVLHFLTKGSQSVAADPETLGLGAGSGLTLWREDWSW